MAAEGSWSFLTNTIKLVNSRLSVEEQNAVVSAGMVLVNNGVEYLHKSSDSTSAKKIQEYTTKQNTQTERVDRTVT